MWTAWGGVQGLGFRAKGFEDEDLAVGLGVKG
jgi:hypothetical protein